MTELINAFFEWGTTSPYSAYFAIAATVCFILNQVVAYVPASVTTKIPNWIMVVINVIALRHGTTNATNIKGNLK